MTWETGNIINGFIFTFVWFFQVITPYMFLEVVGQWKNVLWKKVFVKFCKFHRKTLVLESLCSKVTALKPRNFIKKRLQHRRFLVKIVKFLRKPILLGDR